MTETAQESDSVVKLAEGIHWIGVGVKSFLNRNIYLRTFKGNGKVANMLLDPGPTDDFDILSRHLTGLIGDVSRVHMAYVNHQDPDVVGNLPYLAKLNPKLNVMATEDTWRLVGLSGMQNIAFHAVERFKSMRVLFPTGHTLQFVPTPFCHFRGACMLYDLESRILFTGDFFGGIAAANGMWADRSNWAGIKAFHQIYMPSNDAIRLAVQKIRSLEPKPLMLAPQHGGIITGDLIDEFLAQMDSLSVGLDIIDSLKDKMPALIGALNEINSAVAQLVSKEHLNRVVKMFHADGSFPSFFTITSDGIVTDIKGEPLEAVAALISCYFKGLNEQTRNLLKSRFLRILLDRNLPPFDVLIGQEEYEHINLVDAP